MQNNEIIQILQRYAANGIANLTKQDAMLQPINELVQKHMDKETGPSNPIDAKTAESLTLWSTQEQPFTEDAVRNFHAVGKQVLEMAIQPTSNNDHLVQVALFLRPLFSRDSRTSVMGFDLDEYMDWYFKDTTRQEREEYAKKLMSDWHQN